VGHFAQAVLPCKAALLKHRHKVREQGVFQAFEQATETPSPILIIAICSQHAAGAELLEGARQAAAFNHTIFIALPNRSGVPLHDYNFPGYPRIRFANCNAGNMWSQISQQILQLTRS